MQTKLGFKIVIYSPSATPGVQLIRKSNWDGLGIVCPRYCYAEAKDRSEFRRSGVYMLIGKTEDNEDAIYIGETENVRKRLDSHYVASDKEFWQRVVIFMRQGDEWLLNKGEVRYLETELCKKAKNNGRYKIQNSNMPQEPNMPQDDKDIMKTYLDEMLSLLPIIGVDGFEEVTSEQPIQQTIYYFEDKNSTFKAEGYEIKGKFVIKKGSIASQTEAESISDYAKEKRENLKRQGILQSNQNGLQFSADCTFNSLSGAAGVICGYRVSGPSDSWKDKQGNTPKENKEREIGQSRASPQQNT